MMLLSKARPFGPGLLMPRILVERPDDEVAAADQHGNADEKRNEEDWHDVLRGFDGQTTALPTLSS
jgi:hypothetical protein